MGPPLKLDEEKKMGEGGRGWGKTGVGGIEGRGELQRRGGGVGKREEQHMW